MTLLARRRGVWMLLLLQPILPSHLRCGDSSSANVRLSSTYPSSSNTLDQPGYRHSSLRHCCCPFVVLADTAAVGDSPEAEDRSSCHLEEDHSTAGSGRRNSRLEGDLGRIEEDSLELTWWLCL